MPDPDDSLDRTLADRLKGTFICFDGGEGCGKSTQILRLRDRLATLGLDVLAVRDPGSTRIGEEIRHILLNPDHLEMGMRCEMLLYMAARAQMMHETIRPALDVGGVVLTDRFISSTLAYQLGGDGLTADEIRTVGKIAVHGRLPDLTIILDMPIEQSVERVRAKFEHRTQTLYGEETTVTKDRIELRSLDYHRTVRENFLAQAKADPKTHRVIAADQTPDQVATDVWKAIESAADERG
jgi:dTMP kinase